MNGQSGKPDITSLKRKIKELLVDRSVIQVRTSKDVSNVTTDKEGFQDSYKISI